VETATRLLRGNYAFQRVETPAGRHRVRLLYEDRALNLGIAVLASRSPFAWYSGSSREHHAGPALSEAAAARECGSFRALQDDQPRVALGAFPPSTNISPLGALGWSQRSLPLP